MDIIIVDGAFDKFNSKASFKLFYSVLKNCFSKKTIIFTSKTDKYLQYCDEFGYIKDGKIIEQGV
jgi:energy-coupling factor transporter ATP-binding protein EcfA2